MKEVSTAKTDQRDTLRICGVPDAIPIGEALRNADRIAVGQLGVASMIRPASVAWDSIKDASAPEH